MKVPNEYRIKDGIMSSDDTYGNNGAFEIPYHNYIFNVICSDGEGWEHVSVSLKNRTPSWKEMCFIKDLFWEEDECVLQFHPPKKEYINQHDYCLHLWKPIGRKIETPNSILVGINKK